MTATVTLLVVMNCVLLGLQLRGALRAFLNRKRALPAAAEDAELATPALAPEPAEPLRDPAAVRALLAEVDAAARQFRALMDRRLRTFSDLVEDAGARREELEALVRRAERTVQMCAERLSQESASAGLGRQRFREAERMMRAGRSAGSVAEELGLQRAEVQLAAALAAAREQEPAAATAPASAPPASSPPAGPARPIASRPNARRGGVPRAKGAA